MKRLLLLGGGSKLTVRFCDIVDQFHNEDGLSDTSATKETNFSALLVRSQQVHNL